jgi:hypothetical protein
MRPRTARPLIRWRRRALIARAIFRKLPLVGRLNTLDPVQRNITVNLLRNLSTVS